MSNGRLSFAEFVQSLSAFILLYGVASVPAYAILQSVEGVLLLLTLSVPYFILFLIRKYVSGFLIFLLLHCAVFGAVSAVPDNLFILSEGSVLIRIVLIVFMALSVILSFSKRLRGGSGSGSTFEMSSVAFRIAAIAALAILANYIGYGNIVFLYPILAIALIICYIVHTHIVNIDYALDLITKTTIQPVDSILSFNNKMLVFFLIIVVIAAMASGYSRLDEAIGLLGTLLLWVVRFLFSLRKSDEQPVEMPVTEIAVDGGFDMTNMLPEAKEPALIFVILEKIVMYLFFIALIVGVIAAIVYAFYTLYKKFYNSQGETLDEKEFIRPGDEIEKVGSLAGFLKSIFQINNAPEDRTRRQFYRKVRRLISKGASVTASDTPWEIAKSVKQIEDIDDLTASYEKARYGS